MNEKSSCPVLRGRDGGNTILLLDHMAVSHDGEHTHILNGRLLRAHKQYQNKLKAKLQHKIATKQRGSKRRKRLVKSKQRQLSKLKHQIKEVEHKQTTRLISTLHREGVQTLVIGDVRVIRQDNDVGSTNNQKIHQWSHGHVRHLLTYKAQRRGMAGALQDEQHTSRTRPVGWHVRENKPQRRVFRCTDQRWRLRLQREGVRGVHIMQKDFGC